MESYTNLNPNTWNPEDPTIEDDNINDCQEMPTTETEDTAQLETSDREEPAPHATIGVLFGGLERASGHEGIGAGITGPSQTHDQDALLMQQTKEEKEKQSLDTEEIRKLGTTNAEVLTDDTGSNTKLSDEGKDIACALETQCVGGTLLRQSSETLRALSDGAKEPEQIGYAGKTTNVAENADSCSMTIHLGGTENVAAVKPEEEKHEVKEKNQTEKEYTEDKDTSCTKMPQETGNCNTESCHSVQPTKKRRRSTEPLPPRHPEELMRIREETRGMKCRMLCRMCKQRWRRIVNMPCNCFITCEVCGSAGKPCLRCGTYIETIIKIAD